MLLKIISVKIDINNNIQEVVKVLESRAARIPQFREKLVSTRKRLIGMDQVIHFTTVLRPYRRTNVFIRFIFLVLSHAIGFILYKVSLQGEVTLNSVPSLLYLGEPYTSISYTGWFCKSQI